jgi:uncharacterized protein (TIGR03086 family)
MADLPALFRRNAESFGALVDRVGDGQWSGPTPCTEWDVRTLVNHVVYEQLWAPHLCAGETIADVGDRYEGDVLGDDPKGAWHGGIDGSRAAFDKVDLDATVHLSFGDVPASEYLVQMVTDLAVHGWDLAKATGGDTTIDPETATLLLDTWSAQEELVRGSGVFGDEIKVGADADDQAKLLALLGRDPS